MSPRRIQRSRAAGWTMPEGAIYVGRPTYWGNDYRVVRPERGGLWHVADEHGLLPAFATGYETRQDAHQAAVVLYWRDLIDGDGMRRLDELAGRDLACWCPESLPCHANVLLTLAAGADS